MERTIKRRIIVREKPESSFSRVDVNIDYWSIQVPTYENAYSVFPRWKDNQDDPYICTASFKDEYVQTHTEGKISRSADNMLPAFFVYESDSLSLDDQLALCKKVQIEDKGRGWIFSQTYSGSKSIHTLVWIDPSLREGIAKDFKYYWKLVGEIIFGKDNLSKMDSQCASIGRLSRNPNGKREKTGIEQTCIYFNPTFQSTPMNIASRVKEHTAQLEKDEANRKLQELARMEKYKSSSVDEYTKLERIHNKGDYSEAFELAYDVIVNNNCPKGANYVSAGGALKGCGFSREFVENMLKTASRAHPTNIQERSIPTILNRLGL